LKLNYGKKSDVQPVETIQLFVGARGMKQNNIGGRVKFLFCAQQSKGRPHGRPLIMDMKTSLLASIILVVNAS
jgi:hypothetical protein